MDRFSQNEIARAQTHALKNTPNVGASQGGVGRGLINVVNPTSETMNKVLHALGLGHLEVALVVRERKASNDDLTPEENTYVITSSPFRYPVRGGRRWARSTRPRPTAIPRPQPLK